MDHINLFQTNAEFLSAYNGSDYVEPWVSYTMENSGMSYNKVQEPVDYSRVYLTFKIKSDGEITWLVSNNSYATTINFSKDNGNTWSAITSDEEWESPTSINVVSGDTLMFKGTNMAYGAAEFGDSSANYFQTTCEFEVEGNIMSLIYGDNFVGQTSLPQDSAYTFLSLFSGSTGLTSAENLVLPATTLTEGCYYDMFYGCTNLTTAPALPATALTDFCYERMFYNCRNLATAPELPATILGAQCYFNMFTNCRSLTTAPELSATTLATGCYSSMFNGCTGLTTAPELPATTLAENCYNSMFYGCTNLNYIKCLATDISATNCTANWVKNVQTNSGTFVKPSTTDWSSKTGNDGIPANWTVEDAS